MSETYTIEQLTALPDADLNALAAKLRGWKLREPSDPASGSFLNWVDSDGVEQYSRRGWRPATDRNQSGDLLAYAETKDFGFMIDRRGEYMAKRVVCYDSNYRWLCEIPGNTARSETVAFCAAMLAMAGRLK